MAWPSMRNAVIVNTDFAAENPEVVTGALRAIARGTADAIADPAAGARRGDRAQPGRRLELETRRPADRTRCETS